MAAAAVLTREKDFEDLLGTGKSFVAPDRKYLRLADDVAFPRTNYSLEELKEYALRAQQKRRFWEDLGHAADDAGVPLSSYAYAQGAHREAPETSDLLSPDHDDAALSEGLQREARQNQRNAAHAARIQSTGTLWEQGHDEPTMKVKVLRGPGEVVGETVGHVTGAVLNRAGSGYRGDTSDSLAKQGGAAVGRTTGRAVDSVLGTLAQGVGEVFGFEFDHGPPKGIPRKIQQPPPGNRLRKQRGEL
jgi:hypothetical protein